MSIPFMLDVEELYEDRKVKAFHMLFPLLVMPAPGLRPQSRHFFLCASVEAKGNKPGMAWALLCCHTSYSQLPDYGNAGVP